MEKIIIHGGKRLSGSVKIEGAKNAVLPVIAAAMLASKGTSRIYNVPELADVYTINEVLRHLNTSVNYSNKTIMVNAVADLFTEAPFEFVKKMRASFLVMGPLLARVGHATIALPGGCAIGSRPIDQHLKGFEAMGAEVTIGSGSIEAHVSGRLKGAAIYLDFPSVGATENIIMAATLADGETVIENAACEPEIVNLAQYCNAMGAKVSGAGTSRITIEGVSELHGAEHSILPDRIEAGTYMIAAAITGGDVFIEDADIEDLRPLIAKLRDMGVLIEETIDGIRVIGSDHLQAVDIKTMPHPGFPTDLQAPMMAILLKAKGTSVATETVFENRFMHVEEFRRMNASIKIEGRSAIISGPCDLQGAEVAATDLRAGAALVLAGLVAKGYTRISNLHHIDRGYVDLTGKLRALGADIERVSVTPAEQEAPVLSAETSMRTMSVNPKFA
ncbi:MAG: UDP-N-acetylglucosamine 1-carboxyvinyltransferase [Sporolactobacillus sp.]